MLNNSEILTEQQYKTLGMLYRPDSEIPEATVKRFLKQDEVKTFADDHLLKALTDLHVDIDYLLTEKKELYAIAKKKEDVKNALAVIHSFEDNLGLRNKVKLTETRQIKETNYRELLPKEENQGLQGHEIPIQIQTESAITEDFPDKIESDTLKTCENQGLMFVRIGKAEQKEENKGLDSLNEPQNIPK